MDAWFTRGGGIEKRASFTIYQALLTYMPTLIELVDAGHMVRFDAELGHHEHDQRRIFMLHRVPGQIGERIEKAASDRLIETSPIEQLDQLMVDFCAGSELLVETQFKCLKPVGHGVWELKTADVRLFGWFHEKDCFICTAADTAYRVKKHKLYKGYILEAARLRSELIGEHGVFVEGIEADDVLSNWD